MNKIAGIAIAMLLVASVFMPQMSDQGLGDLFKQINNSLQPLTSTFSSFANFLSLKASAQGDATPPTVTLTFTKAPDPNTGWFNSNILSSIETLSGNLIFSDDQALASGSCTQDGAPIGDFAFSGSLPITSATASVQISGDGQHVIICVVTDKSNNSATITRNADIDRQVPVVDIGAYTLASTVISHNGVAVTYPVSVTETGSGIAGIGTGTLVLTPAQINTFCNPDSGINFAVAVTTIICTIPDIAGNVGEDQASVRIALSPTTSEFSTGPDTVTVEITADVTRDCTGGVCAAVKVTRNTASPPKITIVGAFKAINFNPSEPDASKQVCYVDAAKALDTSVTPNNYVATKDPDRWCEQFVMDRSDGVTLTTLNQDTAIPVVRVFCDGHDAAHELLSTLPDFFNLPCDEAFVDWTFGVNSAVGPAGIQTITYDMGQDPTNGQNFLKVMVNFDQTDSGSFTHILRQQFAFKVDPLGTAPDRVIIDNSAYSKAQTPPPANFLIVKSSTTPGSIAFWKGASGFKCNKTPTDVQGVLPIKVASFLATFPADACDLLTTSSAGSAAALDKLGGELFAVLASSKIRNSGTLGTANVCVANDIQAAHTFLNKQGWIGPRTGTDPALPEKNFILGTIVSEFNNFETNGCGKSINDSKSTTGKLPPTIITQDLSGAPVLRELQDPTLTGQSIFPSLTFFNSARVFTTFDMKPNIVSGTWRLSSVTADISGSSTMVIYKYTNNPLGDFTVDATVDGLNGRGYQTNTNVICAPPTSCQYRVGAYGGLTYRGWLQFTWASTTLQGVTVTSVGLKHPLSTISGTPGNVVICSVSTSAPSFSGAGCSAAPALLNNACTTTALASTNGCSLGSNGVSLINNNLSTRVIALGERVTSEAGGSFTSIGPFTIRINGILNL